MPNIYFKLFSNIILILLSIPGASIQKECDIDDYEMKLSPCDPQSNTQIVSFILLSDCEYPTSIQPTSPLYPYINLHTYNVSCKFCSENETIKFDYTNKILNCEKCPKNTYNNGRNLIISKWSFDILQKYFVVNCFSIDKNNQTNKECSTLSISDDKKYIYSGNVFNNENYYKYIIQIIIPINTNYPGKISLSYKYDSIKSNGEIKFLFDYELLESSNNEIIDYKIFSYDFKKGKHELVIFYSYININNENKKLYINKLKISNISDYTQNECFSINEENCNINSYFDEKNNKCINCKDNEYYLQNFNYKCEIKPKCTNYDFSIKEIGRCINNKKKLIFDNISNNFCISDDNKLIKEKIIDCNSKKSKKNTRNSNILELNLTSITLNNFFDENYGWYQNEKEIFTGIFNQADSTKKLSKTINMLQKRSKVNFAILLNLKTNEEFLIILNEEIKYKYTNIHSNEYINFTINLEQKENKLNFIYKKHFLLKEKIQYYNPVSIKNLKIISLIDQNSQQENKCPSYSYMKNGKCILNEILYNSNEKIKINLFPLKNYQNFLCEEIAGYLCYDNNKFLGPITEIHSDKKIQNSIITKNNIINSYINNEETDPLFYISLFEPLHPIFHDYMYLTNEIDDNTKGHIFGLFTNIQNTDNHNLFNDYIYGLNKNNFFGKNDYFNNSKIIKVIANDIKNIFLIKKSINILYRSGVFIEFSEGDTCIYDHTKKFKSYIYLRCAKSEFSIPTLTFIKNNKCTYIFQWDTPYACKNCLKDDIVHYEATKCKNGIRNYIFESNEECLIFNSSEKNYDGNNMDFNENIIDFNNIFEKNIFPKNLRNLLVDKKLPKIIEVENSKQLKKFKFTFIEKNIYQMKCRFYEDFSWKIIIIVLVVIILHVIVIICVIVFCCKYRNVKYKYRKIMIEKEYSDSYNNKKIKNK